MANPIQFIENQYNRLDRRVRQSGDYWNERSNGFLGVLVRSLQSYTQRGTWEASAMSYYALFSIFPLLLLLVVGFGRIIGPSATSTQIQDFLGIFLPGPTATDITSNIDRFVSVGSLEGIVAFLTLSWSGVGLFSALSGSMDRIFRVPKGLVFWKRRILGLVMVLTLGVLLVANIVTSLLFSFIDILFLNQANVWVQIAGIFVPFGFSMGLFAMIYRWIPRARVGWDAIWAAALVGGILWEFAKWLFAFWLDWFTNLNLIYGSISTVIIFMAWAYYTASIVILCGEFCVNLSDWLTLRRQAVAEHENEFAGDYYLMELNPQPPEYPALHS